MNDEGTARRIDRIYRDPLDEIWLGALRALGVRVERSAEVYASYDGRGTLTLSTAEHMDADDSLAQLIFHELCHALVAGDGSLQREDWGLSNLDRRDLTSEHACHRVQAALSAEHGLRALFAVTTEHRPYWDALPEDPLVGEADPAVPLARAALDRARRAPFGPVLQDALARTARVAEAARGLAEPASLWAAGRGERDHRSDEASREALVVRHARRDDYAQVRAIYAEVDALHRDALPWMFRRGDDELRPDELLAQLTGDAGALLIAERGRPAKVVGFVVLLLKAPPEPRIFAPGKRVVVDALGVAAEARRQGVGTALMREAEAWAREHGAVRVELNVYDANPSARRFYEAAGYQVLMRKLYRRL